jgi:peptidoglycan/LPS O-acetylase OafA/YrhL
MNILILARRFTIITLFAAIFAITFSAAVVRNGGGGSQSHFGASYTCLEATGGVCLAAR